MGYPQRMPLTVSHLYRYPLKSAAPLSLDAADIEPRGIAGDRRWMVVSPEGRFLTGRRYPMLTLIEARPVAGGLLLSDRGGQDPLQVACPPDGGPSLPVVVWDDTTAGHLAGAAADAWLSARLGVDCRLVYMAAPTRRQVDTRYAPEGDVVSFADGFPLLLATDGSLADLNGRLSVPVGMARFRPNIVVSGVAPFAEDGWSELQIGAVVLGVVKPCARCVFTTVDPQRGERVADGEPLRTLATYRKQAGGVMFGQNLTVRQPGRIAVGDPVAVW